jgi:Zn-dependent membrane protease YugP
MSYYLLLIIISSFSWVVSSTLKRKFKKYSRTSLRNGMSGSEIAEKMLFDHGITNVKVICVKGKLTDHYNPKDRTVNLSESVFNKRNAAAAAVAAHECGHAVQHAKAYSWLQLRSAMVPVTSVVSRLSTIVIFIGIAMYFGAGLGVLGYWVVLLGFLMMGISTLFCFITLPVEYDASRRALAWLKNRNMVSRDEYAAAEDALRWAARTYLVAALGALATLMYWVMQFFGRR